MTKGISLKKAIEILGGTEIELHKGYYYCSGFFNWNGQLYYISTMDLRTGKEIRVMYRTAKDRKDYTGGTNTWDFASKLAEKGYHVSSVPHTK